VAPGLRQTHDDRRNELTGLYAALEVARDKVVGAFAEAHGAARSSGARSMRAIQ
jgi:hypothetical protein